MNIMGAAYSVASPRVQIPELLALHRRGELRLTRTYRLEDVNRRYSDPDAGKNIRGVIVFD